MKLRNIRLILVLVVIAIFAIYWAASTIYDNYIASEHSVKLPFGDENKQTLYINDVNSAKDPTYSQLIAFLKTDDTDNMTYNDYTFNLGDIIVRVHDNAEKAGIRAGIAELNLASDSDVFACDVFQTTDEGQVLADCAGLWYGLLPGEDSILYIPDSGTDKNKCYYIPLENATKPEILSLLSTKTGNMTALRKYGAEEGLLGTVNSVSITW